MKKFTQIFVTFAFAFMAAFSVSSVAEVNLSNSTTVHADVFAGKDVSSDDAKSGEANKIMNTIYKAANIFSGFVLGISIIMIIVGGLRYILANGDQRQAEQGKMILIYSGIGIVIALSAFVIARLFSGLKFS